MNIQIYPIKLYMLIICFYTIQVTIPISKDLIQRRNMVPSCSFPVLAILSGKNTPEQSGASSTIRKPRMRNCLQIAINCVYSVVNSGSN